MEGVDPCITRDVMEDTSGAAELREGWAGSGEVITAFCAVKPLEVDGCGGEIPGVADGAGVAKVLVIWGTGDASAARFEMNGIGTFSLDTTEKVKMVSPAVVPKIPQVFKGMLLCETGCTVTGISGITGETDGISFVGIGF